MYYSIFRNNSLIVRVKPLGNSELVQKEQEEDYIRLNFNLVEYVELKVGDYIRFEKNSQVYKLNKQPRITESLKNYRYECIFEGYIHELSKVKMFLDTYKDDGFYRDYSFSFRGKASTFLDFIIQNLQRVDSSFQAGTVVDTEYKTIEFNNWNVFEALTTISEEFGINWYLEGKTLYFGDRKKEKAYIFQVGRKIGFISLTRALVDSQPIETVVYGFGGTDNIPSRSSEDLQYDGNTLTDNRLKFEGENGESKLSNNVDKYGIIESVQIFEDIYPEFIGAVYGINPDNRRQLFVGGIGFDINDYLIPGVFPKLVFLTGKLAGKTFNITYTPDDYSIILDYFEEEGTTFPNELLYPQEGDEYKFVDIYLPQSYIDEAENRLQEATQKYLNKHSSPLESYSGELDSEYIRNKNIVLNLGDLVRIKSSPFGLDALYPVVGLTQSITNPNIYKITFGDILPKSLLSSLKIINFNTSQSISSVQKNSVTNNNVTNVVGGKLEWQHL